MVKGRGTTRRQTLAGLGASALVLGAPTIGAAQGKVAPITVVINHETTPPQTVTDLATVSDPAVVGSALTVSATAGAPFFNKAIASFKIVAENHPDFVFADAANYGIAECLMAQGKRAEALAQACLAKTELTSAKLQEHEVRTAAEIAALRATVEATTRSLIEAETRLAKAIEDLGDRFDHMTGRLDSFIDNGRRKRAATA